MTPHEAFAEGFLQRCAEENLSREQTEARVKQAAEKLAFLDQTLASGLGGVKDVVKGLGKPALLAGLAAPPLLGAAAGLGLSRVMDRNAPTAEEIKSQELIDTLYDETGRLDDVNKRRQERFRLLKKSPAHRIRP